MENKFLTKLLKEFEQLNKVPKFQLERAISPFLGIFIIEIINKIFKTNVAVSIPEFPYRPLKHKDNNQSINIDWLLIDKQNKILYLIELKTDKFSFRKDQSLVYAELKKRVVDEKSFAFLTQDLNKIIPKSRRQAKYKTLTEIFDKNKISLSEYKNLSIIYLAPELPKNYEIDSNDKLLLFSKLPVKIKTHYKQEWHQLRKFLKNLSAQYGKN